LQGSTRALEEKLGPLLTIRELDTKTPEVDVHRAIREGIELFNEERYWESHESLEAAWRRTEGAEKELLQGVILIAAALVHLQKNDRSVAFSVMGRAEEKLGRHHGESFGINIDRLHQTLSRMIAAGQLEFFKIQPNP
jgi:predicted metal-dependent hydrolase